MPPKGRLPLLSSWLRSHPGDARVGVDLAKNLHKRREGSSKVDNTGHPFQNQLRALQGYRSPGADAPVRRARAAHRDSDAGSKIFPDFGLAIDVEGEHRAAVRLRRRIETRPVPPDELEQPRVLESHLLRRRNAAGGRGRDRLLA